MLRFDSRLIMLAVVFMAVASLSLAADKKQLTAVLAAVEANLKTPAGKQYDDALGKEFPAKYLASIRQCKQSNPAASTDPFDLFLRLNGEGKVQEALVYPETAFSLCTRTALATGQFSLPPHGDYWINIHLQLK